LILSRLVGALIAGFLLGDVVGLLPFVLARWKRRPGMAALALLSCGAAGALFFPLCIFVALVFSVVVLAMGRWDPERGLARQAAAIRERLPDAAPRHANTMLTSERFRPK
jgi:hypothetical protein